MNRAIRFVALLLVVGALIATSLSVMAQDQEDPGPADVVAAIYAAIGEKDVDAAVELLAEDAVLTLIPPPGPMDGTFIGKEEIGDWFAGLADDNGQSEFSNVSEMGNTASMNLSFTSGHFNNLGVSPAEFDGVAVVQDGLLKSVTWVMTPEFLAKLEPAEAREANRTAVVRYMEELWNQGNLDVADELLAEDFVSHNFPEGDREAVKASVVGFREENPTAYFSLDDVVVTEDRAFILQTVMVRPEGAPPDAEGEPTDARFLLMLSLDNGMITDRWLFNWAEPPQ